VTSIVTAGVSKVVASVEDPNPSIRGRGFEYLRKNGVTVEVGLGADAATRLNQPFFTLIREHRPFVILKAAVSLDGCMAAAPGVRTRLTASPANRHAHRARAEVDAIGVGVGTILIDDPLLTARGAFRARPLTRIIFDRRLRTPAQARVLSTGGAGPVIIVTSEHGVGRREERKQLEAAGADIVVVGSTFGAALSALGGRQIASLLLEGGASVHAAAWSEGLVDFVRLYVTATTLGDSGVKLLDGRPFVTGGLFDRRVEPLGPDVLIEGYVHGPR
jgi:diaminohydroxyphosphoribosylaminopyrimidine deaminase/5-amino-6-(5-phosphoribosylamino)uracil reductase